jgi:hypothetical protein
MAISRTWNLRLNLDEFNALLTSLFTDVDRAWALQGLGLGANAGQAPEDAPPSFQRGFALGAAMRQETEDYRRMKSEFGAMGGRPKKPDGLPSGLPDGEPSGEPSGEPNPQSSILNPLNEKPVSQKSPERQAQRALIEEIVQRWNDFASVHGLATARLTDGRADKIRTRLKDKEWLNDFQRAMDYIAFEPFYRGGGQGGWKATLDYLLKPETSCKLAEAAIAKGAKPTRRSEPAGRQLSDDELSQCWEQALHNMAAKGHDVDNRAYDTEVREAIYNEAKRLENELRSRK